jgi:hypothetical protein
MSLVVEIRRNSDGKTVIANKRWSFSEFMWSEGNYSCDCNRGIMFDEAIGSKESEPYECGQEKFSVRLTHSKTKKVFYDE